MAALSTVAPQNASASATVVARDVQLAARSMTTLATSVTPVADAKREMNTAAAPAAAAAAAQGASVEQAARALWTPENIRLSCRNAFKTLNTRYPTLSSMEILLPEGDKFVDAEWILSSDMQETHGLTAAQSSTPLVEDPVATKALKSKKAEIISPVTKANVHPDLEEVNTFATGVVVPIVAFDEVKVVLRFLSRSDTTLPQSSIDELADLATGIVSAGLYGATPAQQFLQFRQYHKEVPLELQREVYQIIAQNGLYPPQRVYAEVDWFFRMGLAPVYFNRFGAKVIANHIQVYIASRDSSVAAGNPQDIWLAIENNVNLMGGLQPEQSLHMIPNETRKIVAVERNIIRRIRKIPNTKSYSLEMCMSQHPLAPTSEKKMCLYILQTHDFVNPNKIGDETENNIYEVASTAFLKEKSKLIRDRYQEIINTAKDHLGPVARVYPVYRDGTIPLMFTFRYRDYDDPTTNYLLHLTQLLQQHKLQPTRKFIETFANNFIVFSLYLPGDTPQSAINALLKEFSLLHLVPQNETLTPKFLDGSLAAEEYAYLSATSRLLFYVISQRPDEYNVLLNAFKNDPVNLGRLRNLYRALRKEAVSQGRIMRTMLTYPNLIQRIYKDFEDRVLSDKELPRNTELETDINQSVKFSMDHQILMALLNFNRHVLKTNFFRQQKSSISFRLSPQFFADMDLPQLPYGVFFVMGAEFQGFHIRFADVARGGIRLIRSRDDYTYNNNLASLFNENYNLAYTQNLKNKDIPEFGSKGTILLNADCQKVDKTAFQKYIAGIVDLLVLRKDPNDENYIADRYGKEEILFLGPDEYTAGFMEWAALYARKRGYAYWRAFTTGKPPSLGGIPHDTFGMTTTSVHRYALGCIERLGWDESKVTKVQTGGPDGDLGSNEILVSKDKTVAVIDGSGVAYDPDGLNREELIRLAKKRIMIENFDTTKLGPGGFLVKVSDSNVTLPNGEKVESGLQFRNEFHLHPLCRADMFVPCGGRPESINANNVHQLLDKNGQPKFKVIVEGANLFVTQDARMRLEEAGIILYKDASANKGGVTSSSLEVLAALSLPDAVFAQNMTVVNGEIPEFYKKYVAEIKERIANDAYLEFDCIWREHERTGTPRCMLTNALSTKINELNHYVNASNLWENKVLRQIILREALPKRLQELVGLETLVQNAPESYLRAIFCAYISSRYIYKYGVDANEFAFFEFMQPYLKQAVAIEYGVKN